MEKDYPLFTVTVTALSCMMTVLILGTWYDAAFRDARTELVECSAEIHDMARKLNVTLAGSCEVTR